MKSIFFLIILIIVLTNTFAQPPGEPPSNYNLVFEDEFDILWNKTIITNPSDSSYPAYTAIQTDIDITKWKSLDWNRPCHSPYRRRYFENAEINTTGTGKVILKSKREEVSKCSCTYEDENGNTIYTLRDFEYTNQMLYSKQAFKYGYFEIRFRIPQPPYDSPFITEIQGFGPNFWMYGQVSGCEYKYSEIDIYEIFGYNKLRDYDIENSDFQELHHTSPDIAVANNNEYMLNAPVLNQITHNVHFVKCHKNCGCAEIYDTGNDYYVNLSKSNLFKDHEYHTIGIKWVPNYIKYYIDDELSYIYDNSVSPKELVPMHIVVDINFNPEISEYQWLPYWYEVDYVKVWDLKNNCGNPDKNICSQSQINNYNNDDTYNEINVSGEDCEPVIIESGMDVDLKANKRIVLKSGFHAKAGSKFKAHIEKCVTIIE